MDKISQFSSDIRFLSLSGNIGPHSLALFIGGVSRYGYGLVWIFALTFPICLLFRTLSSKLGHATGKNLVQVLDKECTMSSVRVVEAITFISAIIHFSMKSLGAAISLRMLTGLPLPLGVLLFIAYYSTPMRPWVNFLASEQMQKHMTGVVTVSVISFLLQILMNPPNLLSVFLGIPGMFQRSVFKHSLAVIGSFSSPQSLFLHSRASVKKGSFSATFFKGAFQNLCTSFVSDSLLSALIMLASASTFPASSSSTMALPDGHALLLQFLNSKVAPTFFCLFLLSLLLLPLPFPDTTLPSPLPSSIPLPLLSLPLLLPFLAPFPLPLPKPSPQALLVFGHALQSFLLPYVLLPLVKLTSSESVMGSLAKNSGVVEGLGWAVSVGLMAGNFWVLSDVVLGPEIESRLSEFEEMEGMGLWEWISMGEENADLAVGLTWQSVWRDVSQLSATLALTLALCASAIFAIWVSIAPLKSEQEEEGKRLLEQYGKLQEMEGLLARRRSQSTCEDLDNGPWSSMRANGVARAADLRLNDSNQLRVVASFDERLVSRDLPDGPVDRLSAIPAISVESEEKTEQEKLSAGANADADSEQVREIEQRRSMEGREAAPEPPLPEIRTETEVAEAGKDEESHGLPEKEAEQLPEVILVSDSVSEVVEVVVEKKNDVVELSSEEGVEVAGDLEVVEKAVAMAAGEGKEEGTEVAAVADSFSKEISATSADGFVQKVPETEAVQDRQAATDSPAEHSLQEEAQAEMAAEAAAAEVEKQPLLQEAPVVQEASPQPPPAAEKALQKEPASPLPPSSPPGEKEAAAEAIPVEKSSKAEDLVSVCESESPPESVALPIHPAPDSSAPDPEKKAEVASEGGSEAEISSMGVAASGSSLSRLAGLGRSGRRQFAVILDEFWANFYGLHGENNRGKKKEPKKGAGSGDKGPNSGTIPPSKLPIALPHRDLQLDDFGHRNPLHDFRPDFSSRSGFFRSVDDVPGDNYESLEAFQGPQPPGGHFSPSGYSPFGPPRPPHHFEPIRMSRFGFGDGPPNLDMGFGQGGGGHGFAMRNFRDGPEPPPRFPEFGDFPPDGYVGFPTPRPLGLAEGQVKSSEGCYDEVVDEMGLFWECLKKLLAIESCDWLFRFNSGVDEDLVACVALREKALLGAMAALSHFEAWGCGAGCVWTPGLLASFGMWTVTRLLEMALVESRPELWGKYTFVLNRMQGVLDAGFSKRAIPSLCLCFAELAGSPPTAFKSSLQIAGPGAGHAEASWDVEPERYPLLGSARALEALQERITEVETAVMSRKGRTGTAAGDVAFPKGKENLSSVLKRYRRKLQGIQQQAADAR